jgi:hypothetical protein
MVEGLTAFLVTVMVAALVFLQVRFPDDHYYGYALIALIAALVILATYLATRKE